MPRGQIRSESALHRYFGSVLESVLADESAGQCGCGAAPQFRHEDISTGDAVSQTGAPV